MAAGFRTLGAIDIYVKGAVYNDFRWLGTCVTSPMIQDSENFLPIMNDITGRSVPANLTRDRMRSRVVMTLNRFSYTAYNRLRNTTPIDGLTDTSYAETRVDHGTLALGHANGGTHVYGDADVDLLLSFNFPTLGVASLNDTPKGRCYHGCVLKDRAEDSVGSRVMELTLAFDIYGRINYTNRVCYRYTEDASYWGVVTPE